MSQRTRVTVIVAILILVGLGMATFTFALNEQHNRGIIQPASAVLSPQNVTPRFEQQSNCAFPIAATMTVGKDVLCGVVVVPESHIQPNGRQLRLAVAVYKRQGGPSPNDAVIFLEGGPGGSAANIAQRFTSNSFAAAFTSGRDAIVFDQRGVGRSAPALDCNFSLLPAPRANAPIAVSATQSGASQALDCGLLWQTRGVDLAAYNSAEDAADVNDIRIALGYDQLDVYGVSYGTLLAQVLMRDYPAAVRDVVLDSVVPLGADLTAGAPASFDHALSLLFAACAADAACDTSYPRLPAAFAAAIDELNQQPIALPVTNSVTGESYRTIVDGNRLVNELHHAMYATSVLPRVPKLIYDVNRGDYALLSALVSGNIGRDSNISQGMFYSVECADMVRPLTPAQMDALLSDLRPEVSAAKQTQERELQEICRLWPGTGFDQPTLSPLYSTLPTLVLSGDFDPITPPSYSHQVAKNLPYSYFVALPAAAHGSGLSEPCAFGIMTSFLDNPGKPNTSCTVGQRVQFVLPGRLSRRRFCAVSYTFRQYGCSCLHRC